MQPLSIPADFTVLLLLPLPRQQATKTVRAPLPDDPLTRTCHPPRGTPSPNTPQCCTTRFALETQTRLLCAEVLLFLLPYQPRMVRSAKPPWPIPTEIPLYTTPTLLRLPNTRLSSPPRHYGATAQSPLYSAVLLRLIRVRTRVGSPIQLSPHLYITSQAKVACVWR